MGKNENSDLYMITSPIKRLRFLNFSEYSFYTRYCGDNAC